MNICSLNKRSIKMKKVIMFTTKTWPNCTTAKEFLAQNKISFIEKDVNVDEDARTEFARRNLRGVPAFLIGEDVVVGLDKSKILELVDHRVIECKQCHAKLRVPINRGEIKVTCPKCTNKFDWTPRWSL